MKALIRIRTNDKGKISLVREWIDPEQHMLIAPEEVEDLCRALMAALIDPKYQGKV